MHTWYMNDIQMYGFVISFPVTASTLLLLFQEIHSNLTMPNKKWFDQKLCQIKKICQIKTYQIYVKQRIL